MLMLFVSMFTIRFTNGLKGTHYLTYKGPFNMRLSTVNICRFSRQGFSRDAHGLLGFIGATSNRRKALWTALILLLEE